MTVGTRGLRVRLALAAGALLALAACDRQDPAPPPGAEAPPSDADPRKYAEAFLKLGRVPQPQAPGCVACHLGSNDPSLSVVRRGEALEFRDPGLQERALKAWPDEAERKKMIHVFMGHPRQDLVAGPQSPHASFRCETCHVTTDRRYDRTIGIERLARWQNFHMQYHPVVAGMPIRLLRSIECVCLKCHLGEEPLPGTTKLNRGKVIFERFSCYACHVTPGMKTMERDLAPGEKRMRKPGPALTHVADKVDKRWVYNWLNHPWNFKPSARMPPFFPRGELGMPPQIIDKVPAEQATAYERVITACLTEYVFSIAAPLELADIPKGLLETEDWRIDDQKERGRSLAIDLGCLGCHRIDENYAAGFQQKQSYLEEEFATNLFGSGSKFDSPRGRRWLFHWLKKPSHYFPDTSMPEFRLTDAEAADILQFLLSLKVDNEARKLKGLKLWQPVDPPLSVDAAPSPEAERILDALVAYRKGDPRAPARDKILWYGRQMVEVLACYSCHSMPGEWATRAVPEGPIHRDIIPSRGIMERMPLMEPNPEENALAVVYLWGQVEALDAPPNRKIPTPRTRALAEGERVLAKYNCQGCHILEEFKMYVRDGDRVTRVNAAFKTRVVTADRPQWSVEWLRAPETLDADPLSKKYPGLVPEDDVDRWEPERGGQFAVRRLALSEGDDRREVAYRLPPSLRTVGRKLDPQWLASYLRVPTRLRPTGARMPTFPFAEGEVEALAEYFRLRDGARPEDGTGKMTQEQVEAAYDRLIKVDRVMRVDCASCHTLEGNGGVRGPELGNAHARLQRPWLKAFLESPASIYPRTVMPTLPAGVGVDDMTDLILNYDKLRMAKVRRGGVREILESLTSAEGDLDELARLTLVRGAGDPDLEEAVLAAVEIALAKRLPLQTELEGLLANPGAGVRGSAVKALVRLGIGDSLGPIAGRLSDADASVKRAALVGIQALGGRGYSAAVARLLADPEPQIRILALQTLEAIGARAEFKKISACLKDPDPLVRRTALDVLERMGGVDYRPSIAACLKDSEVNVRVGAALALANLEARDQSGALETALSDPSAEVRWAALLALSRFGLAPGAAANLLEDEMAFVRAAAAACLLRGNDARGMPALKQILRRPPFDALTRLAVQEGIHARLPAETLGRTIEPGTRTAAEWMKLLGAGMELDADSAAKLQAPVTARNVPALLAEISKLAGGAFITRGGKPVLIPLDQAVEHVLSEK